MNLRACIYDENDAPTLIVEGSAAQINAQLVDAGQTWREVNQAVVLPDDAPPRAQLPRSPDLLFDRR